MAVPLVKMHDISKSYGRVRALENVHLTVKEREIVGLLGDNGAGKSTLIKILSGAVPASSGDIFIRGERADIKSTAAAIGYGIETIYQDSALVAELSIARNFFLGREPLKGPAFLGRMDQEAMANVARTLLKQVGIEKGIIYNSAQNVVRLCRSYPYDICYLLKDYSIRGVRFLPL